MLHLKMLFDSYLSHAGLALPTISSRLFCLIIDGLIE